MITMNRFFALFFLCLPLSLLFTGPALAEKCYMAKDGFAVEQPYMVSKGCFLFHHGANKDLENQSEMVVTREGDLDPDPIHSEFLHYVIERKLIALKKGTPVFSCGYDLQTIARDFKFWGSRDNKTRTLGYDMPQFHCNGVTSMWAPVRPIHESHCFWVAVPLIRCDVPGSELDPMSVTDPEQKDE
jgi:hypothetical protein